LRPFSGFSQAHWAHFCSFCAFAKRSGARFQAFRKRTGRAFAVSALLQSALAEFFGVFRETAATANSFWSQSDFDLTNFYKKFDMPNFDTKIAQNCNNAVKIFFAGRCTPAPPLFLTYKLPHKFLNSAQKF